MKYLKQFLQGGIFLVVCSMAFGFSNNIVFAEPTTEAECKALTPVAGKCEPKGTLWNCSLNGETAIGKCSDTQVCCVPYEKCADGRGICRYKNPIFALTDGCNGDEKYLNDCSSSYQFARSCCVPKSDSTTPDNSDAECKRTCADAQCVPENLIASGLGFKKCPDNFHPNGTCMRENVSDPIQNCCIPDTCTPAPVSGGSGSSGAAAALNYTPLENLPGFENLESREIEGCGSNMFCKYFKALYLLALWIVGISALFMLVVGGFLYLSSAGNTSLVGYAKKTIYGALIGLVIALISWLLLDTINSDLTNLKLSRLSGAVGTGGGGNNGGSGSSGGGSVPDEYKGKGSGCNGIPTQPGIDKQCGDASQNLSDTLKCIADKVGTNNIELSSISDSAGFSKCQNEYNKPPCHHTENSCHYGGHNKNPKSCAADISTKGSSASDSSIVDAAKNKCNAPTAKNEGNHIHVSVSGCSCDYHN